jgi:hypothetical protein
MPESPRLKVPKVKEFYSFNFSSLIPLQLLFFVTHISCQLSYLTDISGFNFQRLRQ